MSRIGFRSGSGSAPGTAHHGFRFDPSDDWIGVDFGWQGRSMTSGADAPEDDAEEVPEYRTPTRVAPIMRHHFITHEHLDHMGALPWLYAQYRAQFGQVPEFTLYMSEIASRTAERLLWQPTIMAADRNNKPRPFSPQDVEGVKKRIRIVKPGEVLDFEHFRAVPFRAGHIPGAYYWIFIPKNGADPVFSSGDFSLRQLGSVVPPADPIPDEFKKFSTVVMESTYLGRSIPPRDQELAQLRSFAAQVLERGGTLVIPSFAIGSRGLEVGSDLISSGVVSPRYPLYYDGSIKDAIRLYGEFGIEVVDQKYFVRGRNHTLRLVLDESPKVVIASSGMMSEGSRSWIYGCRSLSSKKDAVAFIGHQGPGTPGVNLLASKPGEVVQFGSEEGDRRVRGCDVRQFNLSPHADNAEIEALLCRLNPDIAVLNHGDPENIDAYISANQARFPWKMVRADTGVEVETA